MDFVLHGNPTPRVDQRQLLGSARSRPNSAQPVTRRNPITGEEIQDVITTPRIQQPTTNQKHYQQLTAQKQYSKPKGVPGLDLKYLREENEKKVPVDIYDYCLDTPDTASTASWGSARPVQHNHRQPVKPVHVAVRPNDVPGLSLNNNARPPSARHKPPPAQKPTAWDRQAVPDGIEAPSARHQQLYQQYTDEMKLAYKNKQRLLDEEVITRQVDDVKKQYPRQPHHVTADAGDMLADDDTDIVDVKSKWTKARYTKAQLLKKLDAEGMNDQYKNQKLEETVMIDQLSRAVISDPEQNEKLSSRLYSASYRGRGSHRHLHDSKISTRTTATENLLSKRVRFGARILTRNGHDALRQLTGFFFNVNNTLTIYEFKQFGKSAKAIPFINRGTYHHIKGPLKGEVYALTDIYPGGDILISTEGHQTLPQSIASQSEVIFRVTDLDEKEKCSLLLHGIRPGEKETVYAELHVRSREDQENKIILENLQETVQILIKKRGVKTVTGLGRHYRQLDKTGTGWLDQYDLERGLQKFHIQIDQQTLNIIFEILDPEYNGGLDYCHYMRSVLGEMNEFRKSFVRKAFSKLDSGKKGMIELCDIKKFFNLNAPPAPHAEDSSAIHVFLDNVRQSPKQEQVSFREFEEFYEGISVSLESDEEFLNILGNTWNI
ncbi:hypothetical protein LOTGIDRAFT_236023 [Lottia gigantea]|uniref:Calcyphosin-2 PH domain-containing protein n=1 Tax=Lottia gigantea TaxID=225164 RepID=V4B8C9_LOTGI|nr:hypothetical protein LOTGIDRAFT_236023 [Lottia gigantea]ESO84979.1 hypothetical protein LOTGIDRAFT_236023 [Lottia gigantea]